MATLSATSPVLPSDLKPSYSKNPICVFPNKRSLSLRKNNQHVVPVCVLCTCFFLSVYVYFFWIKIWTFVFCMFWLDNQAARLFGPSMFESSKLKVLFLGVDKDEHPSMFPRIYTLTHSDLTSKLTLAISQSINNSQVCMSIYIHVLSQTKLYLLFNSLFLGILPWLCQNEDNGLFHFNIGKTRHDWRTKWLIMWWVII